MGNPTVTPLFESRHDGGFIVSLANGHMSFETGVVDAAGPAIAAGAVLGALSADGSLIAFNPAGADGSQTIVGIAYANTHVRAGAQPLLYVARQAEVNGSELVWPVGITDVQKAAGVAALKAFSVIVR